MSEDGDLRMLGAVDGFAHALIAVRSKISNIGGRYAPRIHARHVRKRQRRDELLRPLKELEATLLRHHTECLAAYKLTVANRPTGAGE